MEIEFDPVKRAKTLADRNLDFRDAVHVFDGKTTTNEVVRKLYGERRSQTIGRLGGVYVSVVWTQRFRDGNKVRRIISMRRANAREIKAHLQQLGGGDEGPR
jgi:uncharacterized DUF497 family protein